MKSLIKKTQSPATLGAVWNIKHEPAGEGREKTVVLGKLSNFVWVQNRMILGNIVIWTKFQNPI